MSRQAPRARRARGTRAAATAAAALLLLSGCGLVGVRIAEGPGGPVRVGAQPTMGPEPEPTETADPRLDGMTVQRLNLSGDCPVRVALHVPDDWTGNLSGSSYSAFPASSGFDGPRLSVYCTESYSDSASEAVSSQKQYRFSEEDTELVAERTGQTGPGYYWTYEANLGAEEAFSALSDVPTTAVGSLVSYPVAGKIYDVTVMYALPTDDADLMPAVQAAVAHLEVEGSPVGSPPEWS